MSVVAVLSRLKKLKLKATQPWIAISHLHSASTGEVNNLACVVSWLSYLF